MALPIRAPQSKSMTQRAIVMAALARRPVTIHGPLVCEDSRHLLAGLRALGTGIAWPSPDTLVIEPTPLRAGEAPIFCGNAGTTIRFLSALALLVEGPLRLDGNERMRQRPIGPLGDALARLGVEITYEWDDGFPPLQLQVKSAPADEISIDMSVSSQFASALLLVAPRLPHGLRLRITGTQVSRPYLDMTLRMMEQAGISVQEGEVIKVFPGEYFPDQAEVVIEPDWSGAAFLLAAAFLTSTDLEVEGLVTPSLQGDAVFSDFLAELRTPREHVFDLSQVPDLISPLAVAALAASHPSRIVGVAHARVKESDRITVLAHELTRLGADVSEHPDGLTVVPAHALWTPRSEIVLDAADDHRMAMAFGILSLRLPHVRVNNPECVGKSFPDFWSVLERIRTQGGPHDHRAQAWRHQR